METLTCPKCQTKMDFMAFLKSLTPWHLKCSHCQSKVRLKKYELELFLLAITVGVVVLKVLASFDASSLIYAVVLTAAVAGFEYVAYMVARKFGVGLELR
jgi:uncharacterized protein (DUF983 family)